MGSSHQSRLSRSRWVSPREWCKKNLDGAREAAQDLVALLADEGVSHLFINPRYRFGADPGSIGDSGYSRHAGDAGGALCAREFFGRPHPASGSTSTLRGANHVLTCVGTGTARITNSKEFARKMRQNRSPRE
jgi:hypothetical protein